MSMNTSVSGLKAASESLSIISNNIANANTVGYKAMDVQFADVYSAASSGGGVAVSGIETNFSQGNTVSTTSATDLAIKGNGFFITRNSNGQDFYTRAGNFNADKDGFLVNPQGFKVMGYATDDNGKVIEGQLVELKINNADMKAKTTSTAKLVANLDARSELIDRATKTFDRTKTDTYHSTTTTTVYDSLGNEKQISAYYTKIGVNAATGESTWEARFMDGDKAIKTDTLTFDNNGKVKIPASVALTHNFGNGSAEMKLDINVSQLTQFGNDFSVSSNKQNGYAAGNFYGISISADGAIVATYSNGQSQKQGYVPVATFANNDGLKAAGNTSWSASVESGDALVGLPGAGKSGTLKGGARENSNVDMSMELVDMIVAQSAYQANTKSISAFKENTSMLISTL
ncbi:flagellar biosynthesis protein FlgE [Endozoicomonas sp. OPT23]|uniref:flagellar hook protein FlgE n=1 Tax=Endozoicomonas sp. OPT23 TaxID=2072845 RepID=UPI00129B43D8|nr:flagellar hook protein FlgE [Endozoicomonas sp. OPT23]MRI33930.1 flagellar biosynthesis protein FlgE [Endozoicomonas sp. OPT23]